MDELLEYFKQNGTVYVIIYLAIERLAPFVREVVTGNQKQAHEMEIMQMEAKAKQEARMYALLDKFSDQLQAFSLELAKLSITTSAVFARLDTLDQNLHIINDKLPRSARTRQDDKNEDNKV